MATLSEFFSHLYAMTTLFFSILILELLALLRSLTGGKKVISAAQYIKLIEEKNPTIRYTTENLRHLQQSQLECTVCLSEFSEGESVRKLKCNHTFHRDCLDRWLQQYFATCPLCRTKVLPDEIVANYHRLQNDHMYDGSDEEVIFFWSALHGNSLYNRIYYSHS